MDRGGHILSLYVIRHGETVWNRERRLQGRQDSPLTPLGEAQARRMGRWLAEAGVAGHSLWTSPLGRARQTAALIGAETGLTPAVMDDLAELGVGAWEGLTADDLARQGIAPREDESILDWCGRAPDGEGLVSLRHRAETVLARITDTPAILVCHGLFSRVFRAAWLGVPEDEVDGGQGVIYRLADGSQDRIAP